MWDSIVASNNRYFLVQVATNGLITLNETVSDYSPVPFPTTDPRIAPFWGDADTTRGIGNVYYRSTTEQTVLDKANTIINSAFVGSNFVPQHLAIVTWFQVGYFSAIGDKVNMHECTEGCALVK